MCGILLLADGRQEDHDDVLPGYWQSLQQACKCRGPHAHQEIELRCRHENAFGVNRGQGYYGHLFSSVLSLRGDGVTLQPLRSRDDRFALAWNGQVYAIEDSSASTSRVDVDEHKRRAAATERLQRGENDGQIVMAWLEEVILSKSQAFEAGVNASQAVEAALLEVLRNIEGEWAMVLIDTITGDIYYGRDPLGRRSLLCSHREGSEKLLISSVCSRDVLAAGLTFAEVDCGSMWHARRGHAPQRILDRSSDRILLREVKRTETSQYQEASEQDQVQALDLVHTALLDSVSRRVQLVHGETQQSERSRGSAPVAVLFSGGLDSTLLAHLTHLALPPDEVIELINVAFENPRVLAAAGTTQSSRYDTPDRLLSRQTLDQLRRVCPGRRWKLIEIDVSYQDFLANRDDILAAMAPCDSVMDLSLAAVLYFASRGVGVDRCTEKDVDDELKPANVTARVYLSGLGADELFGGYLRHRKAFQRGGWQQAAEEMQMDLDRLPTRNLGRDDRIIASHGREARYPFLSLPFIRLVADLPLRIKADWSLNSGEEGKGDKVLLRNLARRFGLEAVSVEKKRAMQFGARSAKMEMGGSKSKGHHAVAGNGTPRDGSSKQVPGEIFTTLRYEPLSIDLSNPVLSLVPTPLRDRLTVESASTSTLSKHPLAAHIPLLTSHLARLRSASSNLSKVFPRTWGDAGCFRQRDQTLGTVDGDDDQVLGRLQTVLQQGDAEHGAEGPRRVRLAIRRTGEMTVTQARMAASAPPGTPLPKVRLDTQPSSVASVEDAAVLRNKTDQRRVYDEARGRVHATLGMPLSSESTDERAPVFDVLLWSRGKKSEALLTESAIANIVIETVDGRLVTPAAAALEEGSSELHFLPGIMRQTLLSAGLIKEERIAVGMLQEAKRVYLCNALRGMWEVELVD